VKKWDLPKGWEWKTLREVSMIRGGNGAPQNNKYFENGKYNFIRTSDLGVVGRTSTLDCSRDKINDMAVMELGFRVIPKNSVLIPKSGASIFLNHRALTTKDSYISSHLAAIVPNSGIDPKFLYYWSTTLDAKSITNDVNYPSLRLTDLEEVDIPVPPLETQKKIVAILDKAEEIKRLRAEANAQTQKLIQSVFLDMFGDPVTNPKGWKETVFGKIIVETKNGLYKQDKFYGSGIPILRMYNIINQEIKLDNYHLINVSEEELSQYRLDPGDILFNRVNSPIWLGKCAVIPNGLGKCIFESKNIRIRIDTNQASPYYIVHYLATPAGRREIIKRTKTAVNQATVNNEDIRNFKIILPPLELQRKYEDVINHIKKTRTNQKGNESMIRTVNNNLLSKAFKGELVA